MYVQFPDMHFKVLIFLFAFSVSISTAFGQFSLPGLTYSYAGLEPFIDSQTMFIHHTKHHQTYITNLNKALERDTAKKGLEEIIKSISTYPAVVRNNAGGHYNHTLFWSILSPDTDTKPSKALKEAIIKQFVSMDSLKILLNQAAMKQFGSGWAWLSVNQEGQLFISSTPNQDNPLMDIAEKKGTPILGIDVWEHAYYLKYQNKRGDYLSAIWNVINWNEVSRRFGSIMMVEK